MSDNCVGRIWTFLSGTDLQTFQILLIMATAAGLGFQVWLAIESFLLKRARQNWPRTKSWLPWIALGGALATILLTAGAVHWASLEAPALFVQRRTAGATIFACLTAINIFQARREQWDEADGETWPYWRLKRAYQIGAVPAFALLFIFRPMPADKLTVTMVEGLSHMLDLPVAGTVFVSLVVAQLLIRGAMAVLGLALLRKIGA